MTDRAKPEPGGGHPESVRIGVGAYVAPDVKLEADTVVGPDAVVLGPDDGGGPPTLIERGALIGANATVLPGLTVGFEAQVRPGAVVTRSVPPRAITEGNPATIVGYVDAEPPRSAGPSERRDQEPAGSQVAGVEVRQLRTALDMRGSLAAAEADGEVPFRPVRWFLVYDVPSVETRGQHAHHQCQQFLVAVAGSLRVVADDGRVRQEFVLDRPDRGLYLPPMTWAVQWGYSADAVLLVLASEPYDAADYIRDYQEFLTLAGSGDDG